LCNLLSRAMIALGKLDGLMQVIANPEHFVTMYVP